ncbi:hypothetical protein [Bacillus manliponensis]|uniref:hypothetical protein n=1 Tax=Bacillus manliponensis TaxID=574376 RepID=UPI003519A3AA
MQTENFALALNTSQLESFETLSAELQNEITKSLHTETIYEVPNVVQMFKVRKLNVGKSVHTITYIETPANYYVFTYVQYESGPSIRKQTISKTTLSMFQLLRNEGEGGVSVCGN